MFGFDEGGVGEERKKIILQKKRTRGKKKKEVPSGDEEDEDWSLYTKDSPHVVAATLGRLLR